VRAVHGDVLEGGEQTTMIFGRTAEELLEKEQLIDKTKYQVLSREEVRDFHKYMGDYSADLDMSSLFVKSDLKKSGVLADKYPRMNIEEMMTDMLSWHQKADSRLVHQYAELANLTCSHSFGLLEINGSLLCSLSFQARMQTLSAILLTAISSLGWTLLRRTRCLITSAGSSLRKIKHRLLSKA